MMTSHTKPNQQFQEAVCREIHTLKRMAVWYTGNVVDAEDLIQDTLMLAIRFQDGYKSGSNLRAWLLRVMRNRHISLVRRRRLERRVQDHESSHALTDWSLSETGRRSMLDGGGVDADTGFSDPVELAMSSLKPEFRDVVLMCDVEEMSYQEAAQRAACPVGTVMSRLHRGRRALKGKLVSRSHLNAA
jgi:RNA polymerase sigma-70 factor (ECF subfamily)